MEFTNKISDKSFFIKDLDKKLLEMCKPYYSIVSVSIKTDLIPGSLDYPFSEDGNIFAKPIKDGNINGFPAIWKIVEKLGISKGCGNSHQHQITEALTKGIFIQKDNEWYYKLHSDVVNKIADKFGI